MRRLTPKRRNFMRMCILALLAFQMASAPAFALSCAPPVMNEQAVEGALAIFEGVVEEANQDAFLPPAETHSKNDMGKSGLFVFRVTKAWKGVKEGEQVKIRRNTYWGDDFPVGHRYLVVAEQEKDGVLQAGLCGPTMPLEHAGKEQEFLKKHFGE